MERATSRFCDAASESTAKNDATTTSSGTTRGDGGATQEHTRASSLRSDHLVTYYGGPLNGKKHKHAIFVRRTMTQLPPPIASKWSPGDSLIDITRPRIAEYEIIGDGAFFIGITRI